MSRHPNVHLCAPLRGAHLVTQDDSESLNGDVRIGGGGAKTDRRPPITTGSRMLKGPRVWLPPVALFGAGILALTALASPLELPMGLTSRESPVEPTGPSEAPGPLSEGEAAAKARETGQPVEASELTTSRRLVTALPGGSFRAEMSLDPVRVRDQSGAWAPVDTTMVARPDGTVGPARTVVTMSFSGGGAGAQFARITSQGRTFALGWRGTLPAPVLAGSAAVFRDVEPGVDLVAQATALGFSTFVVVRDAGAAKNPRLRAITFDVQAPGTTITTDAEGEIAVKAGDELAFRGERPMAWDSAGLPGAARDADRAGVGSGPGTDPGLAGPDAGPAGRRIPGGSSPEEAAAAAPLSARGNRPPRPLGVEVTNSTIVLRPGSLLTDASTVFPLVLDPTWTANEEKGRLPAWTMVWSTGEKFFNSTQNPRVGYDGWSSTTKKSRVYYRFDTSSLAGRKVDTIELEHRLDHTVNQNCSLTTYGPNVQIYRTQEFSSTTTWSTQPAVLGSVLGANNTAVGHDNYCPGTKNQYWALGGIRADLEAGIDLLKLRMQSGDEADRNGWRVYNNALQKPTLRVEYREYPSTPTDLKITHSKFWAAEGKWYTRRKEPAISFIASHPNVGGNLGMKLQILSGASVIWENTDDVPSSPRWFSRVVPAGRLGEGGTYQIRAWSVDPSEYGDILSKNYASLTFTVDTVAPAPPTLIAPSDRVPKQKCIISQPCSFTVSGAADVASFECGLNTDAPLHCADTTAGASITRVENPATFGPGWFTAHAIDKAGNRSAAAVKFEKVESAKLSHRWSLDGNGADSGEHGGDPARRYTMSTSGLSFGGGASAGLDANDRALTFDGTDDYAITGASDGGAATIGTFDTRSDRDFSVGAWVRLSNDPGQTVWAVSSPGASGVAAPLSVMSLGYENGAWVFQVVSPNAVLGRVEPDDARLINSHDFATEPAFPVTQPQGNPTSTRVTAPATTAESPSAVGRWVHLVGIFNDRSSEKTEPGQPAPKPEITIWVDGRQVGAPVLIPETAYLNKPELAIGCECIGTTRRGFWPGAIDEVRLFPGVLDRGQVLRIASERRPYGPTP